MSAIVPQMMVLMRVGRETMAKKLFSPWFLRETGPLWGRGCRSEPSTALGETLGHMTVALRHQ